MRHRDSADRGRRDLAPQVALTLQIWVLSVANFAVAVVPSAIVDLTMRFVLAVAERLSWSRFGGHDGPSDRFPGPQHPAGDGFPRFWNLFQYFLPRKLRERVYIPAYEDLKTDYAETKDYEGRWERRWLKVAFTSQTALLVVQSIAAALGIRITDLIGRLLPWVGP